MTKLEILKAQKEAMGQAIYAIGALNKLGLTSSFDTLAMEKARAANKCAFALLGQEIAKLEAQS